MLSGFVDFVNLTVTAVAFILGWWFNGYFRRNGVKSPPAYLPFIGHMVPALTKKKHLKDISKDVYDMYPNERYCGLILFGKPLIMLKDIELIKQISVKDYDCFLNHIVSFEEGSNVILASTLITLQGQKWKDMRATMSPAFTSSKMKEMFQFVVDCGEQMAEYYTNQMKTTKNAMRGLIELEIKDAFTRYTNDVVATCAFGLEVNSFNNESNEFYEMGKDVSDFSGFRFFKVFLWMSFPTISKFFNIQLHSTRTHNFYSNLIRDTIKLREDKNIIRSDMVQLLMEAMKGKLKHDAQEDNKGDGFATVEESDVGKANVKRDWTHEDIVAQAVMFYVASFDTTSTLLCFMLHELAIHPEIQKRLQEEIDEVAANTDGKLTYDSLLKMKYLDMVVSETLRRWPPSLVVDRKCTKPYTLPPPNEKSKIEFQMNVNDGVWIPVYALHHDPQHFKDPDTFNPERFSEQNKHNIKPFSYLPFGAGPRGCIGSRFALLISKAVAYNMLLRFDVVTTARTQHPIKLKLNTFNLHSEKGFWLALRPRNT